MSSEFYLTRTLRCGEASYSESELLAASSLIVVLAEPGGGKTRLLGSLAAQLQTRLITANAFLHKATNTIHGPIVIDAFDELAKVDSSGIYQLLGKASDLKPPIVVLSSRSSEWSAAYTKSCTEFFECDALVVYMTEFSDCEQQQIFENYTPGEDFKAFKNEVGRFNLEPLLLNPQFLKLFADAYIESDRKFANKNSILELAIERLAKESNPEVSSRGDLPFERKKELAEKVFAILLLSGSEGVSSSDPSSERLYPRLRSLIPDEDQVESILATRLFKPCDKADQHRPVHKIVSEYCAAKYLIRRLAPTKNQLSLSLCLSVVAPNSAVRDELRGLLAWVAALGDRSTQEAVIDLDPYAVLANGDPSRLLVSSKRRLLRKLKETAEDNPYFRGSDIWRTFSAVGFFTVDIVDELKVLLTPSSEGEYFFALLLELLAGSEAIPYLTNELQKLILSSNVNRHVRLLANDCLMEVVNCDLRPILDDLITEANETSLELAATIIHKIGPQNTGELCVANFLRACANLYPSHPRRHNNVIGGRDFIKSFVSILDLQTVERLLDDLTQGLTCECGKESYECDCRTGISKIVGSLLDRFFELSSPPFDAQKIWGWVKSLHFYESKNSDQSLAVRVLQEDDILRQGMIKIALEEEVDRDRIHAIRFNKFGYESHSGLIFRSQDKKFVVDLAFETDNTTLWSCFIVWHQFHRNETNRGNDVLRRHMRMQAQKKPAFLQVWSQANHVAKRLRDQERRAASPSRRRRRYRAM